MEVHKLTAIVPTSVLGTDEQGRTLVRCPECGETATVQDDGRITCSLHEAISEQLHEQLLERLG